jgi:hypothetical protein
MPSSRQPQAPLTQVPDRQKLKQPPQWAGSVSVFTQPSGQQVCPLAQQRPWQQGPEHWCPQAPQLLPSVVASVHTPLQQVEREPKHWLFVVQGPQAPLRHT